MPPIPDPEFCYRAVSSKDSRFDGWFFTAVQTTGIYCRPSCPATTPRQINVRFYPSAAAAQQAGFRACLRCRPDAAPGSPEWNSRADLVGRAMRLIGDGVVDREGVGGLARRLGYAERHVHRQLVTELGAGPLALARAQRAQTARVLIENTAMSFADIAFASGFASVRQFNDTVGRVYAATPTKLRTARKSDRGNGTASHPGEITLRLPYREPFDATGLLSFLETRAIGGIESVSGGTYARTLRLPHGPGTVSCDLANAAVGHLHCTVRLADLRDLTAAVSRLRQLLDLDADPAAVDTALSADPVLAPLVAARPGIRVPGAVDGFEIALRAVVGQQISVAAMRTVLARLVEAVTDPLSTDTTGETLLGPHTDGPRPVISAGSGLTHLFPTPRMIADLDDETAAAVLPMPAARRRTVLALASALAAGDIDLDPGADPAATSRALRDLPGIGPWTAGYIGIRALSDPDGFLPTDLGVKHAARVLGLPENDRELTERTARWRPWRAYAQLHLWHRLGEIPA